MTENRKKIFLCYHYNNEHIVASKIQKDFEGNPYFFVNGVETKKMSLDSDIKKWIDSSLSDNDVVLLIIGKDTLKRKWVLYELKLALDKGQTIIGLSVYPFSGKKTLTLFNHKINLFPLDTLNDIPKFIENYLK